MKICANPDCQHSDMAHRTLGRGKCVIQKCNCKRFRRADRERRAEPARMSDLSRMATKAVDDAMGKEV